MFILIIEQNNVFKFNIYLITTFYLCYNKHEQANLPCLDHVTSYDKLWSYYI
jgi:hypothetical protein